MQQRMAVDLVSLPNKDVWAYSKFDLEKVFLKVKENQFELLAVLKMANDSLLNKEDGSNGLADFGIFRGTNSDDVAHALVSKRSSNYLQKMIDVEAHIIAGIYTSVCKKCGNHISLERLLFIPETKICQCCAK